MVSKGFLSVVSGHQALLVFMISSVPSGFFISHVHHEPKFPTALAVIVSWKVSKVPRLATIASYKDHLGIRFSLGSLRRFR